MPEQDPQVDRQRLAEVYKELANRVNTEIKVYWSRNNVFLVVNAGILAFAFSDSNPKFILALALAISGIIASSLWLLVAMRGREWLRFWENRLMKVERDLPEPHVFHGYWTEGGDQRKEGEPEAVTSLIRYLPITFLVLWLLYIILLVKA